MVWKREGVEENEAYWYALPFPAFRWWGRTHILTSKKGVIRSHWGKREREGGRDGASEGHFLNHSLIPDSRQPKGERVEAAAVIRSEKSVNEWRALLFSLFPSHYPSIHLFTWVWSVDRRVHSGIPLVLTWGIPGKDLSQLEEPLVSVGGNNFPWIMERAVILH